jgi:hypothetical protein
MGHLFLIWLLPAVVTGAAYAITEWVELVDVFGEEWIAVLSEDRDSEIYIIFLWDDG